MFNPSNEKFRSNVEIKKYLDNNPDVKCDLNVTNVQVPKELLLSKKSELNSKDIISEIAKTKECPTNSEKKLKCLICDEKFECISDLEIHLNTEDMPGKCDLCFFASCTQIGLSNHMETAHGNSKSLTIENSSSLETTSTLSTTKGVKKIEIDTRKKFERNNTTPVKLNRGSKNSKNSKPKINRTLPMIQPVQRISRRTSMQLGLTLENLLQIQQKSPFPERKTLKKKPTNYLETLVKKMLSNQENGKWTVKLTMQKNENIEAHFDQPALADNFEDIVMEKNAVELDHMEMTPYR